MKKNQEKTNVNMLSHITNEIHEEAIKSEKRVILLNQFFLFSFSLLFVLIALFKHLRGGNNFNDIPILLFLVGVYFYWVFIYRSVEKIRHFELIRILNITVEVSTISICLLLFYRSHLADGGIFISPISMLYIVVLAMTGFRYSFKLSLYAVLLVIIQYLVLYFSIAGLVPLDIKEIIIDLGLVGTIQKVSYLLLAGIVSGLLASYTRKVVYKVVKSSYDQIALKDTFGQYVSKDALHYILSDSREVTTMEHSGVVLFSDIRGFTSLMEKKNPKYMISQLNEYFASMVDILEKNGGFINKFIGDAIVAVFGLLEETEEGKGNSADSAIKAALEMSMKLEELNRNWEAEGRKTLRIGIGIHYGNIIMGNIGCENRMEFTCLGKTINETMEIENLTKYYRCNIIASGKVVSKIKNNGEISLLPLSSSLSVQQRFGETLFQVIVKAGRREE